MSKLENIEASLLISSYLDTIGFYNGIWEFNYDSYVKNINDALSVTYKIVHHYMSLGGFNNISIKKLIASDDTILLMATLKGILDGGNEIDFINRYIEIYNILLDKKRGSGIQTLSSISFLKKIIQKHEDSYLQLIPIEKTMGGNGAAIRTGVIGIYYAHNIDDIINKSITASRLTHNIPMGYLGGFISALFASYAFNGIHAWLWIENLLELIENNKILNYINSTDIGNNHDKDIKLYFSYWFQYYETRYNDILNYRHKQTFLYPKDRLQSFENYITFSKFKQGDEQHWSYFGGSGLDSIIYSYDCLLMSLTIDDNGMIIKTNPIYNLDLLIFYSCLFIGDSDSIGSIVGLWYGLLMGYTNFDRNKLKDLEYYNEIKILSNGLFNKIN